MFVLSANSVEELAYKINGCYLAFVNEKSFQKFLGDKFPGCSKHYSTLHTPKTTWELERSAQVFLFGALEGMAADPSAILDYTLMQMDPQPNQVLGFEDVQRGLKAVDGKKVMGIVAHVMPGGDGFEERCRMYER